MIIGNLCEDFEIYLFIIGSCGMFLCLLNGFNDKKIN